jgi:hypothetical protein
VWLQAYGARPRIGSTRPADGMLLDGPAPRRTLTRRTHVVQLHDKTRVGDDGPRLPGLAQPREEGLRGISQADLGGYFSMFLSDSRRGDVSHA